MLARLGSRLTYANVMATIAVFIALGGGAIAAKSLTSSNGTITGCVAKKSGAVAVVAAGKRCPKGTKKLVWSQTGPTGATGAVGAAGQPGPPGTDGSARAYAHVLYDGTLDVANSKGVVGLTAQCFSPCASPAEGPSPVQCFDLEFKPQNGVATTSNAFELAAQVSIPAFHFNVVEPGCSTSFDDAEVATFKTSNGLESAGGFYVIFN